MNQVQIVEVGPRDGFQSIAPLIPTERKIAVIQALYAAGVRRMEATSFVSQSTLPQLADAADVLAAAQALPGLDPQVLVPTARHADRAIEAGATHLAFVLSVSEAHNQGNVRRTPAESAMEYSRIVKAAPAGTEFRLNVATAFDCPHLGRVSELETLALLEELVATAPQAEVALCDTTGRVTPKQVHKLFTAATARFPEIKHWAFHAHDTFGLGAANVLAAWNTGVRVFDGSVAGLGGCPFAPGATGNVATEDLIYMFDGMTIESGIDLRRLIDVARAVAELPGAQTGGRVRAALAAWARVDIPA